jgi:hypothetical protein
MHHAIQCRELDWSPGVDWDPKQAAVSRRRFLSSVADTDTLLLPIHFPAPTAGLVTADGDRFITASSGSSCARIAPTSSNAGTDAASRHSLHA